MEQRHIGNTDLQVTALGYGAMELRLVDQQEATRLLNAVLDGGINYIDTSPDYGPSEEYIGRAIAHRRDKYTIATKCGCNPGRGVTPGAPSHIWTGEMLQTNIENSLKLLRTDHIDVWQLHGTMPEDLAGGKHDQVIQTMQKLKGQGKVRSIGVSFRNGGSQEALYPAGFGFQGIQEFMGWGVFDMMQIVYGGLTRKNEVAIAQAGGEGIGIVVRGVVKRYRGNYDQLYEEAGLDELQGADESRNAFLIRFALSHPHVSTAIIGTKSSAHLAENIEAAEAGPLPADVYAEAKRRFDAVGIVAEDL